MINKINLFFKFSVAIICYAIIFQGISPTWASEDMIDPFLETHVSGNYVQFDEEKFYFMVMNVVHQDIFVLAGIRDFFQRAIEIDNLDPVQKDISIFSLATMAFSGLGGEINHPKARGLFLSILESDALPDHAIVNVKWSYAYMLFNGLGGNKDLPLAGVWFNQVVHCENLTKYRSTMAKVCLAEIIIDGYGTSLSLSYASQLLLEAQREHNLFGNQNLSIRISKAVRKLKSLSSKVVFRQNRDAWGRFKRTPFITSRRLNLLCAS